MVRTPDKAALYSSMCIIACLIAWNFYFSAFIAGKFYSHGTAKPCHWKEGDPVLYNLHATHFESFLSTFFVTPSANTYKVGHWFHFAENFLPELWLLPLHQRMGHLTRSSSSSHVYFNLDQPGLVKEMNGFTRLVATAALTHGNITGLHFIHMDTNWAPWTNLLQRRTNGYSAAALQEGIERSYVYDSGRTLLLPREYILEHLYESLEEPSKLGSASSTGDENEYIHGDKSRTTNIGTIHNTNGRPGDGSGSSGKHNPINNPTRVGDGEMSPFFTAQLPIHRFGNSFAEDGRVGDVCVKYLSTVGGRVPRVQRRDW